MQLNAVAISKTIIVGTIRPVTPMHGIYRAETIFEYCCVKVKKNTYIVYLLFIILIFWSYYWAKLYTPC